MFERYTEDARRTIFFAKMWARRFGAAEICSEHLLLGIMAEANLITYLLRPASAEEILIQIKEERASGQALPDETQEPLSKEAKEILKLGAAEAGRLQEAQIGNEHLLLGVLKKSSSYAAQLLMTKGVSLLTVYEQVARLRQDPTLAAKTDLRKFIPSGRNWIDLGVPEGYAWPRLLFNPPSETMILEVEGTGDEGVWRPTRLLVKHKDATKYTLVGNPDNMTSCESPVTSLTQPLLGYNVMTWRKNENSIGGDWKELNILNLETGEFQYSIRNCEVILPEEFNVCWINKLLTMSDDGKQVYLTAGLSFRGEDGIESEIRQVLAILDLTSKSLHPISTLRGTFF